MKPPVAIPGLSGTYATSTFVAALQNSEKTLKQVESDLTTLSSAITTQPEILIGLSNPTLTIAQRLEIISAPLKSPSDITKNLFSVLAENNRLSETEHVIANFNELMAAHRGEKEVIITSATELDSSSLKRLQKALDQASIAEGGAKIKYITKVNPALEGGLTVEFGGKTLDLSVASRVQKLNALLSETV